MPRETMATRADKVAFACNLADINSSALELLSDSPELFDIAAQSALVALTSAIAAVRGQQALAQMLQLASVQ